MWGAEGTTGHGKSSSGRGQNGQGVNYDASNMYLYWAIQVSLKSFE